MIILLPYNPWNHEWRQIIFCKCVEKIDYHRWHYRPTQKEVVTFFIEWYKITMAQPLRKKEEHLHITHREGFCGGAAIINGTKFPVRSVVNYILVQGWTPEELVRRFDHLSLAQVYDALAYYYDHKEEIDEDIKRNEPESVMKDFPELGPLTQ